MTPGVDTNAAVWKSTQLIQDRELRVEERVRKNHAQWRLLGELLQFSADDFYITAAGRNRAVPYVRQYVEGKDPDPVGTTREVTEEHLYTVLPTSLLLRYVAEPALRARTKALFRGRTTNPLWYRAETDPRRIAYLLVAQANQLRKYAANYPVSARDAARSYAAAGTGTGAGQ